MRHNSLKLSLTIVAFALELFGCAQPNEAGLATDASVIRVTAADLSALPPGETLFVDLADTSTTYELDGRETALDISRITIGIADGTVWTLRDWLKRAKEQVGEDLLADGRGVLRLNAETNAAVTSSPAQGTARGANKPKSGGSGVSSCPPGIGVMHCIEYWSPIGIYKIWCFCFFF